LTSTEISGGKSNGMELPSRKFTKIWINFTTLFSFTEIQENAVPSVIGYFKKFKPQFLSKCKVLRVCSVENP